MQTKVMTKRRRTVRTGGTGSISSKITTMVSGLQRNIAQYLNRKTAHWSGSRLRTALLLFCLASGIVNAGILLGISGPGTIPVPRFSKMPEHIGKPVTIQHTASEDLVSKRLLEFGIYTDSIACSGTDAGFYDSFRSSRPGLLDSIRRFVSEHKQNLITTKK